IDVSLTHMQTHTHLIRMQKVVLCKLPHTHTQTHTHTHTHTHTQTRRCNSVVSEASSDPPHSHTDTDTHTHTHTRTHTHYASAYLAHPQGHVVCVGRSVVE